MRKKQKSTFAAIATPKHTKEHLFVAVASNNLALIQSLVDSGLDVNVRNINDSTPLHVAAANGYTACLSYLLSKSADINAAGYWKQTPLHVAVKHNHLECAIHLLKHGADITLRDAANNTALDISIEKEYHQIIDLIHAAIDDRKLNAEITCDDLSSRSIEF